MRVAVVSGSRADFGPLRVVYDELLRNREDAVWIDIRELPDCGTDSIGCSLKTAAAIREATIEIDYANPDWVMVLGDRYEILGATVGAYIAGYPIAHLSGGDVTEGSQDDCMRHAITKLAHIHFPDNTESARRIVQLGECPTRVHTVGSVGIDRLLQTTLLSREATFKAVGLESPEMVLLVCFHPNTLGDTGAETAALHEALRSLPEDVSLVLMGPNQDAGAEVIRQHWQDLANERAKVVYHEELPREQYLSLLRHCQAIVGNSSAGLHEAPSFRTPAVNIGDRQQGRLKAVSVIDCEPMATCIKAAIGYSFTHRKAFHMEFCVNPYGDGDSAPKIVAILKSIAYPKAYLKKRFYEFPAAAFRQRAAGVQRQAG